ncbi:MAG: branched-chain amino acid ABC transporter permease [Thermodesulfobacteriota bacterium]
MKSSTRMIVLVFLVALLLFPLFMETYFSYVLCIIFIAVINATGLNLVTGYSGQTNLGQSGFVAIGAYATALFMTRMGIGFWGALPAGGLITAFVGLLIAIPALRMRGLYLALVTFGFAAITEMILIHWVSLTHGPDGIRVPSPEIGSFAFNSDLRMFYLIFAVTAFMVYMAKNIVNSRVGRAFISIRESEIAAQAMGVDITRYKIMAFILSAFYGGIAGGLWATLAMFISPDAFGVVESIIALAMIAVGGMGSILGSIIGGALLSFLPEILREAREFQELLFGAILVISLIFLPNGIVGLHDKIRRGLAK